MSKIFRTTFHRSESDNRKSKIQNGVGLSPLLSHSQHVGWWLKRSSRKVFPR
jgi:hypothetical protein